jgi:hypothetical protein
VRPIDASQPVVAIDGGALAGLHQFREQGSELPRRYSSLRLCLIASSWARIAMSCSRSFSTTAGGA